jgi:hypothetical protein
MHTIQVDRKKRKIPSQWNELTPTAFKAIVRILQLSKEKHTSRILCLRYMLDINDKLFAQINAVQMSQLLFCTDFLFKENRLTKNLFPVIKTGFLIKERYHGPSDNFGNLTFDEFITADTFFMQYARVKDLKAKEILLNRLIAVLYREKETKEQKQVKGDIRVSFNGFDIDQRSKHFRKVSAVDKHCILMWYMGCRKYCEESYPYFFSKGNQKAAEKSDWRSVLIALPNDKLGSLDKIEKTNVHYIFYLMNETIKNSKDTK